MGGRRGATMQGYRRGSGRDPGYLLHQLTAFATRYRGKPCHRFSATLHVPYHPAYCEYGPMACFSSAKPEPDPGSSSRGLSTLEGPTRESQKRTTGDVGTRMGGGTIAMRRHSYYKGNGDGYSGGRATQHSSQNRLIWLNDDIYPFGSGIS